MTLFQRLFGKSEDPRSTVRPLYDAIVAQGRQPVWYLDGAPDTVDGRFDMIAGILTHVLIRLERDPAAKQASVWLAELFVDDMDSQLRQIGIGDVTVGKHVGQMMSALGGRLTAYREADGEVARLREALVRNLWRTNDPGAGADTVAARLAAFAVALNASDTATVLAGHLPELAR